MTRKIIQLLLIMTVCLSASAQMVTYKKYAKKEGLAVAYVPNFAVDSATKMGVIMIKAKTTAAWNMLVKELDLESLRPEGQDGKKSDCFMCFCTIDKRNCCLSGSFRERKIFLFYPKTTEATKVISSHLIKRTMQ